MTETFIPAKTIDEVIVRLEDIISECIRTKSPLGYFAVLYQGVTKKVKEHIALGTFEDGERMEKLDVIFANRYLEAYEQFKLQEIPSSCWKIAFEVPQNQGLTILQTMLMGMNAHINYDLAIAAQETVGQEDITQLKRDFDAITDLLLSMLDEVETKINKVSPIFKLIDWVGGRTDEKVAGFIIDKARDFAWNNAVLLNKTSIDRQFYIQQDVFTTQIAERIAEPGLILKTTFKFIRWFETRDSKKVILTLQQN
jgi:hypothetical protein